jgi:hypothetical protein
MLKADIQARKMPQIYPEEEHDSYSLWESATGHAGKVVKVEEFGFDKRDQRSGMEMAGRKNLRCSTESILVGLQH